MTDKEFAVFLGYLRGTDMVEVLYDGQVLTTYSCGLDPLEGCHGEGGAAGRGPSLSQH